MRDIVDALYKCMLPTYVTYTYGCFFLQHEMQYVRLVRQCLRAYGLLCLGVYRLLDDVVDENEVKVQRTLTEKRYVITHPPTNFQLIETDRVSYSDLDLTYLSSAVIYL